MSILIIVMALEILMILGSIIALEAKNLLTAVISMGIVGFGLTLGFLCLQAPDLAIVQIVVETLTLIILIAAILKTTGEDTSEEWGKSRVILYQAISCFVIIFLFFLYRGINYLPPFGAPIMRMSTPYLEKGLSSTGAANIVAAVILDFRGYDTLGEATVLFTAVMGILAVMRKIGRKTNL